MYTFEYVQVGVYFPFENIDERINVIKIFKNL